MTRVTDENCPHGASLVVAHSRVYGIGDGGLVRYTAIGQPTVWTPSAEPDAVNSAGFINVAQHAGGEEPTALALHRGFLIVFFRSSTQIWRIDADPSRIAFQEKLPVGCSHHRSIQDISDRLIFLSQDGFRTLSLRGDLTNLVDIDVGTPIEDLTRDAQAVDFSMWSVLLGQYWCGVCQSTGMQNIWVLTVSASSGLLAWSQYSVDGWLVVSATEANQRVFLVMNSVSFDASAINSENPTSVLVEVVIGRHIDRIQGQPAAIPCEARTVVSTMGSDGHSKRLDTIETVMTEGEANISVYNGDMDTPLATMAASGDGRASNRIAIGGLTTGLSLKVESNHSGPMELQQVAIQYRLLRRI